MFGGLMLILLGALLILWAFGGLDTLINLSSGTRG